MPKGKPKATMLNRQMQFMCIDCRGEIPDPALHLNNTGNAGHMVYEVRQETWKWEA